MIEINLIPEQLRKKRKTRATKKEVSAVPKELIIGMGGGFILILVLVHIGLQSMIGIKMAEHSKFKAQWEEILPAKVNVENVLQKKRNLEARLSSIKEVIGDERLIRWSQKLNLISDNIPRGVWLSKMALTKDSLLIKGSAVSKDKTEMLSPHTFRSKLMDDQEFKKYFADIELSALTTRSINTTSIADFLIRATLEE